MQTLLNMICLFSSYENRVISARTIAYHLFLIRLQIQYSSFPTHVGFEDNKELTGLGNFTGYLMQLTRGLQQVLNLSYSPV